jgi:hypothetical protein
VRIERTNDGRKSNEYLPQGIIETPSTESGNQIKFKNTLTPWSDRLNQKKYSPPKKIKKNKNRGVIIDFPSFRHFSQLRVSVLFIDQSFAQIFK